MLQAALYHQLLVVADWRDIIIIAVCMFACLPHVFRESLVEPTTSRIDRHCLTHLGQTTCNTIFFSFNMLLLDETICNTIFVFNMPHRHPALYIGGVNIRGHEE